MAFVLIVYVNIVILLFNPNISLKKYYKYFFYWLFSILLIHEKKGRKAKNAQKQAKSRYFGKIETRHVPDTKRGGRQK